MRRNLESNFVVENNIPLEVQRNIKWTHAIYGIVSKPVQARDSSLGLA